RSSNLLKAFAVTRPATSPSRRSWRREKPLTSRFSSRKAKQSRSTPAQAPTWGARDRELLGSTGCQPSFRQLAGNMHSKVIRGLHDASRQAAEMDRLAAGAPQTL